MASEKGFYFVLTVALSLIPMIAAGPDCQIEWEVDWDVQPVIGNLMTFENPGEIVNSITVTEVLEVLGLAWNAPSWQVIAGLVCVRFGPFLNHMVGDNSVRRECDQITTSLRNERSSNIIVACINSWTETGLGSMTNEPLVNTENNAVDNQATVEKLSSIAFELLEWLGPSPFSGDVFGGCSALRLLLSMQIESIINRIKIIVTYPLALLFEGFGDDNICDNAGQGSDNLFYITIIDALFNDTPFCRFLSRNPSNDEFINRAASVINNIHLMLTDETICRRLLNALSNLLERDSKNNFYILTGVNLDSLPSKETFCRNLSTAFDPRSTFTTRPYFVPTGQSFDTWNFISVPGEILPGFYVQDAANVLGAFLRSGKLVNGLALMCSVFESFLVDTFPDYAGNVTDACVALQQMDLAKIEDNCLEITVPLQYGDHPISLRIPTAIYMIVTGVEVTRVLFDLDNISAMGVCESVNEFYNSDNNLQSVVRLSVDTYLAEILPIAHNICEDYDTIYSYILLNAGGDNVEITESVIRQFILAHLGFSSRSQLCYVIANGIDMSSGRAESDLVKLFQSELLTFIEDEGRCTVSADSFLRAFELTNGGGVDGRTFLFQYTGYRTTEAACKDLNRLFRAKICSGDSGKSGPILRGNLVLMITLNVILWVRYQNI